MPSKATTTARAVRQKGSSASSSPTKPPSVAGARLRCEAALADGSSVVLACDPTLEGVLGATGIGYLAHADSARIRLSPREGCQSRFGEQVVETPSDASNELVSLARRVYRGIERHVVTGCPRARAGACPRGCAGACARRLVYAAASDAPSMAEAVHLYVRKAFSEGPRLRALISDELVVEVNELARGVLSECERTKQFARFSLLTDGSLFASIRPKADTIPLTAGYFAARMGEERFCIVDPAHRSAAFHDSGKLGRRKGYAVVRLDQASTDALLSHKEFSADEVAVRTLWRCFYESVSLSGRDASERGYDLRTQLMPRRFWGGLSELGPQADERTSDR